MDAKKAVDEVEVKVEATVEAKVEVKETRKVETNEIIFKGCTFIIYIVFIK